MQNENIFNFEKLIVYQKFLDFIDFVYELSSLFPVDERYNITDQFRRAATSIALNIGEGSGGTNKEFNAFLRISKRSLKECVVCTEIAYRRKYISKNEEEEIRKRLVEIAKMNSGLSKAIRAKISLTTNQNTPSSVLHTPD